MPAQLDSSRTHASTTRRCVIRWHFLLSFSLSPNLVMAAEVKLALLHSVSDPRIREETRGDISAFIRSPFVPQLISPIARSLMSGLWTMTHATSFWFTSRNEDYPATQQSIPASSTTLKILERIFWSAMSLCDIPCLDVSGGGFELGGIFVHTSDAHLPSCTV